MSGRSFSKKGEAFLPDVKLTDSADSPIKPTARISKKCVGQVARGLKNWWECKEEDFEDLGEEEETEESLTGENEESLTEKKQISTPIGSTRKHRKKKQSSVMSPKTPQAEINAAVYPQDLWFLIAKYIRPEDIGRFAAISPCTNQVLFSANFWKDLYKRFYTSRAKLPDQLEPEVCISRIYGLRTSVIKSLFYFYEPFKNRIVHNGLQLSSNSMRKLSCGICTSFWHEHNTGWTFFFRFEPRGAIRGRNETSSGQRTQLECLDDMWANFEDGACVLKATLTRFTHVPPRIIGQRLGEINLPLSADLRSYRLRLSFQSMAGRILAKDPSQNLHGRQEPIGSVTNVVLDGVQTLKVLDWWHPEFPLAVI